MKDAEKLLTQEEVADLWKMSWTTLRKWRWEGKGPKFIKLGSRVLYRECDLRAYVEANVNQSTTKNPQY